MGSYAGPGPGRGVAAGTGDDLPLRVQHHTASTLKTPTRLGGGLFTFPGTLFGAPRGLPNSETPLRGLSGPDFQHHPASSDIIRRHSVFPCQSAFQCLAGLFAEPFGDEPACKPETDDKSVKCLVKLGFIANLGA